MTPDLFTAAFVPLSGNRHNLPARVAKLIARLDDSGQPVKGVRIAFAVRPEDYRRLAGILSAAKRELGLVMVEYSAAPLEAKADRWFGEMGRKPVKKGSGSKPQRRSGHGPTLRP